MKNYVENISDEENETALTNLTNRLLLWKILALTATGKSSWLGAEAENNPQHGQDQKDPVS